MLLQFTVLNRISGRRRTRVMLVMAGVWAVAWLLLGAAGLLPGTLAAAIGRARVHGGLRVRRDPAAADRAGDLQRPGLRPQRGRYNAINSAAFQAGAITGPIAAGLLLATVSTRCSSR